MRSALNYEALRRVVVEQQEEAEALRRAPFVERDQLKEIVRVLDQPWIKVVIGVRRCGKSIVCHQALREIPYGYLNFDDERLIGLGAEDLNQMLQFLLEIKPGIKHLFFDEIQNVEGWELFANRLQRQGYYVVITGSNSKLLSKELATHLTGRHLTIEMTPFSFREFLRAKNFAWSEESLEITRDRAQLYAFLEEYLQKGGFPEMVVGGYHAQYLRELYDKIVSKDITARYHIKYSKTLKEIAVYSYANLGSRLTYHKLKNIFDISSIHTVKNYFQYLSDAYLVSLLNAFSFKFKETVKQPRKVYTIDNGLSAAISPKFTQDRGAALENLVFQELTRRGSHFHYYATPEEEVDFVVHQSREVSELIQVCLSLEDEATAKREMKALIKAAESLKCKNLKIITWNHEEIRKMGEWEVAVVPIWKWLLAL